MAKLFPVFRQMDQMDCGPTCLLMIASFYGKTLSLAEIRNRSHLTKDGVSLLSLSDVAESIGFQTLSLRITLESLRKQAKLPCIVHLDKNHFSVLYEITNSKVKIADPAIGSIEYDISDFLKRWSTENKADKSGIVLLIETTPRFHKTNSRKLKVPMGDGALKHLFQYLFQYKTQVLKLFICLFLGSGIQLLFPILTQAIVDQGINGKSIPLLYLVLVGQLALTVGRTTLDFTKKWILLHLSAKINISIISEFLTKLMQLPISFFGKTMLGDITRRIEDHSRIERFISSTSLSFGFSMINLVVYSVVLTIYNWKIYLIFFLSSICYLIFIQLFMAKRKELETQRFEESATNASNTIEIVQGIVEIKLNNCEKQKRWSWERSQMRLFDLRTNMARLQQYQEGGGQLINEFRNMIITFIAAQAVIDGSMTLGMMLALQYILGQLISPIAEMLNFIREYQETKMSLRRTTEIHTLENEDQENVPACTVICNQWHRITLDHVSFSYDPTSTKNALNNICLILPRGKVTALVGSSGVENRPS